MSIAIGLGVSGSREDALTTSGIGQVIHSGLTAEGLQAILSMIMLGVRDPDVEIQKEVERREKERQEATIKREDKLLDALLVREEERQQGEIDRRGQ